MVAHRQLKVINAIKKSTLNANTLKQISDSNNNSPQTNHWENCHEPSRAGL